MPRRRICIACLRAQKRAYMRAVRLDIAQRYREALRKYGIPPSESRATAAAWARPEVACSICGIPTWQVRRFAAERRWPKGGERHWQRLTVDRIAPDVWGDRGNLRLLCYLCNHFRGKGLHEDAAVLRASSAYWQWLLPRRQRKWLKSPRRAIT